MSDRLLHLQKATGYAGSEGFLVNLGRGLSRRGWNCRIAVLEEQTRPVPELRNSLSEAGWTVDTITMNRAITPSAIRSFRGIVRQFEPDLINTHLIHGDLVGALATAGIDIPLVSTKHNDDQFKHRLGYAGFAGMLNYPFDHLVTISDHLRDFYRNRLGITNRPITRIHYGLDPDRFLPDQTKPSDTDVPAVLRNDDVLTVGMVARLREQKGHDVLLDAFANLAAGPECHLVLVGDGPLKDELSRQVEELGLRETVHFLGYRSDVPRLLSHLDVFVHPSRWEGFGLVFLEAMATGLPIVATTVSAIPEIVRDGKTGLLVEPDNPRALTAALETLLTSRETRDRMGEAGRKRLESDFSVERMIDRYDTLYSSIIRNNQ